MPTNMPKNTNWATLNNIWTADETCSLGEYLLCLPHFVLEEMRQQKQRTQARTHRLPAGNEFIYVILGNKAKQ